MARVDTDIEYRNRNTEYTYLDSKCFELLSY